MVFLLESVALLIVLVGGITTSTYFVTTDPTSTTTFITIDSTSAVFLNMVGTPNQTTVTTNTTTKTVTLSLPQNIDQRSSPTFNDVTVSRQLTTSTVNALTSITTPTVNAQTSVITPLTQTTSLVVNGIDSTIKYNDRSLNTQAFYGFCENDILGCVPTSGSDVTPLGGNLIRIYEHQGWVSILLQTSKLYTISAVTSRTVTWGIPYTTASWSYNLLPPSEHILTNVPVTYNGVNTYTTAKVLSSTYSDILYSTPTIQFFKPGTSNPFANFTNGDTVMIGWSGVKWILRWYRWEY